MLSRRSALNVTPAQHQLPLAVKGHADPAGLTIGEVAEYLTLSITAPLS
ncbi:MAG TPA: hypothetical protein VFG58_10715 [Solirubrobacterales bacterium]|nr:hypothetical protein [Solirubrobacterales bacterium]